MDNDTARFARRPNQPGKGDRRSVLKATHQGAEYDVYAALFILAAVSLRNNPLRLQFMP